MANLGTLVYVFHDEKILLGRKKYGKAKGKLNGYGGKVEITDNSVQEAALRELKEETGLEIENIYLYGVLNMEWGENKNAKIFVFKGYGLKNNPEESDEMSVKWFDVNNVPKKDMWESDKYWFDLVLQEKKFIAHLIFDKTNSNSVKEISIKFVDNGRELFEETSLIAK